MSPLKLKRRHRLRKGWCQADHFRPPGVGFGFRLIVFFNCSHLMIQDIFVHFLRCLTEAGGTQWLLGLSRRKLFVLKPELLDFFQDPS